MARPICPVHGSPLHYHTCRHVKEAVDSPPHLLPPIGTLDRRIICRDCCTPEVEKLLEQHDLAFGAEHETDEAMTEALANFATALEGLRTKIGYGPVCTECLYEKTGLDLRRKRSS